MANARQQKLPKALIRRTLESARREIEQIERKFHRTPPIPLNAHRGRKGRASEARNGHCRSRSIRRLVPSQTQVATGGVDRL